MKNRKKRIDDDMPIGKLTEVPNFLPPPDQLVFPEQRTVKVTIALKRSSVEFFKEQAKKHKSKYQQMIRELLDQYAMKFGQ
jgi:hypothetical protein